MNCRFIALLLFFAVLTACTTPQTLDTPYIAQRAYLTVTTLAEKSDVVSFAPSEKTVIADAMPVGLERGDWHLVQAKEPEEAVIEPVKPEVENVCAEKKDEKPTTRKPATAKPKRKAKKFVSCAH